ncbi:hypothetical protein GCM10010211_27250 [Streptomyces albospinus]|uniref:Uncharacterized protein n=1 Tax=Streptomyces albospinus TaxID=285515 RepID=A0ABQ2UZ69_9ACTN|nr:hypothetical protein [Streptomyces albospinus]GGU60925.1 hypothetical protein GCM10010211_27250 [Streptomyces albospinus]
MTSPALNALRLVLDDGIERTYLLESPTPAALAADTPPSYDVWVHLSYVLAQQGRDAAWLTRYVGLPWDAAHRIVAAARQP